MELFADFCRVGRGLRPRCRVWVWRYGNDVKKAVGDSDVLPRQQRLLAPPLPRGVRTVVAVEGSFDSERVVAPNCPAGRR
jgi:hypothetical protein